MNKTIRLIIKIVCACLALAALICLVVGFWDELCKTVRKWVLNFRRKYAPEYDYYEEEEIPETAFYEE